MSTDPPIRTVEERLRYENDYVRLYDDDVSFAGGRVGTYLRIASSKAGRGVVLVVESGDHLALVRTYRYPISAWQWAMPRGFASHEDSHVTARQELAEELGITGSDVVHIGSLTPDSGLLASTVDVYRVGTDRFLGSSPLDRQEVDAVEWVPRDQLMRRIGRGEIQDGFTLAALTVLDAWRLGPDGIRPTDPPAR